MSHDPRAARLAVVVIGRNEGANLRRSLASVMGPGRRTIYVDSGSTDGSPALARTLGADVVELDPARPFTAARGRNEGLQRAVALDPDVELVQFVDGDCEVLPGWLEAGTAALAADAGVVAVCGRVRERERERSVYNRLCDLEWDAPAGEALACGGNALMRVGPVRELGGFRADLAGGEEPELCLRLRRRGWRIRRLAADMVLHDADMTRFAQWWRRAVRSGWGYAEGAALHGRGPERFWVRESRSISFWGILVPAASVALAWATRGASLALLAGYAVLAARIYASARRAGRSPADARLQALFHTIAKFPQAVGQARWTAARALRPLRAAAGRRASA